MWLTEENTSVSTIGSSVCMQIATDAVRSVAHSVLRSYTDMLDSTDVTVADGVMELPADTRKVLGVYVDGSPMGKPMSRDYFDRQYPGWQEYSAGSYPDDYFIEGGSIYFYPPLSDAAHIEIVREATFPAFSSAPGAANPLAYWPTGHLAFIADYVLEHLPFNAEHTQAYTRVQMAKARRQEAESKVKQALARMRF